jgi:SAM-dependent methyltransferase
LYQGCARMQDAFLTTNRFSDDAIYLAEDRYEKPKELFKLIGQLISDSYGAAKGLRFLDVGCATGEFVWYLQKLFPNAQFTGIDVSPQMVAQAQERMPQSTFLTASILQDEFFEPNKFDIVTCSGVLSIFDEPSKPLANLLRSVSIRGSLYLATIINEDPVDVIMRYRDVRHENAAWESGWNIFSKVTLDRAALATDPSLRIDWTDFSMPFTIAKTGDPMRTWTIRTEEANHQTINGACQMTNMKVMRVLKPG